MMTWLLTVHTYIDMFTHLHLLTLHTLRFFTTTTTTSMQSDAIVDELQKSNTLCLLLDMVARPAPLLRVPHLRKRFATRACPIFACRDGDDITERRFSHLISSRLAGAAGLVLEHKLDKNTIAHIRHQTTADGQIQHTVADQLANFKNFEQFESLEALALVLSHIIRILRVRAPCSVPRSRLCEMTYLTTRHGTRHTAHDTTCSDRVRCLIS